MKVKRKAENLQLLRQKICVGYLTVNLTISSQQKRTGGERDEEDHGKSKEVENKGIPR